MILMDLKYFWFERCDNKSKFVNLDIFVVIFLLNIWLNWWLLIMLVFIVVLRKLILNVFKVWLWRNVLFESNIVR